MIIDILWFPWPFPRLTFCLSRYKIHASFSKYLVDGLLEASTTTSCFVTAVCVANIAGSQLSLHQSNLRHEPLSYTAALSSNFSFKKIVKMLEMLIYQRRRKPLTRGRMEFHQRETLRDFLEWSSWYSLSMDDGVRRRWCGRGRERGGVLHDKRRGEERREKRRALPCVDGWWRWLMVNGLIMGVAGNKPQNVLCNNKVSTYF